MIDGYDDPWADSGYTSSEQGYPSATPSPPNGLPPGGGKYTTPSFLSFSALVRSASKSYLYLTDEALVNNVQNAIAMKRDPILWGSMLARKRPTSQLLWTITPDDETDPAQAEAAKLIEYVVKRIPRFQKLKMHLLDAIWYGKYAVELAYEWRTHRGQQVLFVRDHVPINGDKMRFKWDGTPGFLVYSGYPGEKESTDYGLAHFVTADERLQYIIHEHEPDDMDWTQPEMAGAIHGVGVRGRLYWFWWLKQQVFAQLMNYLHRFANGLTIFYYQAGNREAKIEAELAARQQFNNTALLYPRWPSENPDTNSVQRLEVGTANSNLLWNLVKDYFDPIMEKYILGQTLSHDTDATGLGSGVADLHAATLAEIIKYDAIDLQETLQTDLIDVLYAYNCPGVTPGVFSFLVDSPDSDKLMGYADQLFAWGVPLDEEQVYEVSQWTKPKPGNGIVTQVGAMSPAAVGGVPQGVPVSGQAGPPSQPQQDGMEMAAPGAMPFSRNGKHPKPRRVGQRVSKSFD